MNQPAKNSKLTPAMITGLSTAIANGNYAVTACQLVGLAENTFYEWLRIADADLANGLSETESMYISLKQSLKRAEAQSEAELVEVVKEAGVVKREWLPAMTFLERRHRERWGRPAPIQINQHNESKTLNITRVEVLLPSRIEKLKGGNNVQRQEETEGSSEESGGEA